MLIFFQNQYMFIGHIFLITRTSHYPLYNFIFSQVDMLLENMTTAKSSYQIVITSECLLHAHCMRVPFLIGVYQGA